MSRILFDHCVPKPLRRWLPGEDVRTCHEEGWDALLNGELLATAEAAMSFPNPDASGKITAEKFDALFDAGADISPWLDLDSAIACKPGKPPVWAKMGKPVL